MLCFFCVFFFVLLNYINLQFRPKYFFYFFFPKDLHAHEIFVVLCPFGTIFIIRLVLIFHVKHNIVVKYLSSAENAARAACIVLADVMFVSIVVIGRSAWFHLHNASESIAVQIRWRPLVYWDMQIVSLSMSSPSFLHNGTSSCLFPFKPSLVRQTWKRSHYFSIMLVWWRRFRVY